jgi:hypothetical protein
VEFNLLDFELAVLDTLQLKVSEFEAEGNQEGTKSCMATINQLSKEKIVRYQTLLNNLPDSIIVRPDCEVLNQTLPRSLLVNDGKPDYMIKVPNFEGY